MEAGDIVIVLARPCEAGNVGAVCRAMKNMGLSSLRLAAPGPGIPPPGPIPQEHEESPRGILRARAVHALDIWEQAAVYEDLACALADCALSVGISRRRGHSRKSVSMNPRELAGFLRERGGRTALVFGNEQSGLDDRELSLCNTASHIPASDDFPSLNLSHAVQIYAWELFSLFGETEGSPAGRAVKGQWVPMDAGQIESQVRTLSAALESIGFYRHPGREAQERFLRDIMARAGLSLNEGRYLTDIISKAHRLSQS